MAADDFQSKYASLMESMIKSAVAETTKLFETMVDELKAEISRIRKENEHLKIRCSQIENEKSQPSVGTGDTERLPRTHSASEKRDTAVQCDLIPLQDIIVENCQLLGYSFSSLEHQQEKMHSSLQKEHHGETCEEESCQMALRVVKEESCGDSCSFMEEDVDLTVACRQVQGTNTGSLLSSAGETEGPFLKEVMSLHGKDPLALKPCHLENDEGLQTNTQSCESEHLLVIQQPVIQDAKSETLHNLSEMAIEGGLTISTEKHLGNHQGKLSEPPQKELLVSVYQESQREADLSVNNCANVTLQQCADVHQGDEQLEVRRTLKNANCEELESGLTEGKSCSKPEKSSIQRRGRLPRRAKERKSQQQTLKDIQSPSIGDHMDQNEVNTPPSTTEKNSCAVDTVNTRPKPAPCVQPKDTTSIISPSLHKRKNTELNDVESSNGGTLPVCSGKEHLPESKQHWVEMEGEVDPTNEDSPANKIQHILTPKSSQAPSLRSRGRCTSVTLEDAMLLVEAMYQSRRENTGSCSTTQSQAQGVPCVPTLQTVDEVPALGEIPLPVEVECSLPVIEQSQPSVETVSSICLTSHATQTSERHAPIKVESHQHDATASMDDLPTEPLSTLVSQARAQTSQQVFAPPVITLSATSTTQNTRNIFVSSLKAHALSSAQLSAVVSAVVSAQKTNSPPSSTAAPVPHGTPPLSSVPQKTIIITTRKPPPVVLAQTTVTSTVNQSMIQPPQKIIIIPRQTSPVVSQKQQTLVLKAKPPEPAPAVSASSPLFVSSQQSNISVNTLNTSELHVTVPSPQIHSLAHQLSTVDVGTVSDTVCAVSQNRDNLSDNLDSQKPTESVSETADAPTEPSASLKTFVPPESEEALSLVDIPLCNGQKTSAVVRLTRLPFTISNEETVLVSKLLSNELSKTFIPTQAPSSSEETRLPQVKSRNSSGQTSSPSDMPESSPETCLFLDGSQISGDARDSPDQPTNSASTLSTVSEPGAIGVSELSTTSYISSQFSSNDSINSDGAQDCVLQNDSLVQQNHSAGLIKLSSIMSKDTSDPHLQMTKSQFLAQLEISPIGQDPTEVSSNSSEDISAGNGKNLQKNSLVPRLRSHLKAHLQAKRTEAETLVEMKTTLTASQKTKLDNNGPHDKNQGSVHVNPEETDDSDSITLRSGPCENEPTTGGSESSSDNASLKKDIRKLDHLSLGLRLSSSTRQTAIHKKIDSTSSGPNSCSSESVGVTPSKSSFSKSGTTCLLSSISSTPLTRRRSLVSKDVPDTKGGNKRKLNAVSPGRYSASISQKTNIKTGSPCARWPRLNQDVASPKKSGESALSKKPRLIQDDTICKNTLKVVNAKKLTTIANVNTVANIKKSNQSLLQVGVKRRQLIENQAGSKDVKKVIVKGIWTPPLLPASEISPTNEAKSKKETKCPNQKIVYAPSSSLYPIPVKAPPIISPLQPLSVIGGRLLKNQCGECGRVFSTSATLENHVGLHTRSRPFSCKLCGKSFLDSKGLKRHDRVHRNGRIHVCPKCGKGFVYTFCLTKHLQMVHGKVKPFNCKVCKKGFFTKRDVEAHIRIHTGEKPFHCNLCERKFPRRADLNVHLRWHNGEKRHWCPFCGKGFLDFNNMKRHKFTHTGEKPHPCPHCPKRFTQSSHLKKHVRNVHKIQ